MSDDTYVALRRRFTKVGTDPTSALTRRMLGDRSGDPWDSVVPIESPSAERSAVVVLAPSGVGKTSELKTRAAVLRDAGVEAFFLPAVAIGASGVAGAMADPTPLLNWKASATRAVFFIDAIDEARLEGHDLERVLLRFTRDIDPATRMVQLVLSSRIDVWGVEDERQIVRALALPSEKPPLNIVRLEPLSLEDVKVYARANGVGDAAAFIGALQRDELDQVLADLRPPDARILVDYWKRHGAFGSWSEMLEASIEASVRNENRRHALEQQFTLEEARTGLARLGAATVLGKRSTISLPGVSHPDEVSAERLFADRRPASTSQLLGMGLFVQKGFHSVQLPQGAPSDFLAARWLGERVRRGWDPRALENALFISPFGVARTFTPPSRSAVVGWVTGFVPALRKRLLAELPHVLLFEGDPSKLSRGECVEALRAVLADIKSGRHDSSPTRGTVRQIAKHQIAEIVVRLLGEFAGTPRAERLLLRIAEEGRYAEVSSLALAIALSPGIENSVGAVAIRVVAAVGSTAQRAQLLTLATHPDEWMRLAIVQALAPEMLNGPTLVQLVVSMTGHETAYMLSHELTEIELADIDAILVALGPSLTRSTVTSATQAHVEIASRLALARLVRAASSVPSWMPSLLLDIESFLHSPIYLSSEVVDGLEALLLARVDLRRSLWEARLAAAGNPSKFVTMMRPRLGAAQEFDLEWLWEKKGAATEEQQPALRYVLSELVQRMSEPSRTAIKDRKDVAADLKEFIDGVVLGAAEATERQREWAAKQATEFVAKRAQNIVELEPLRGEIEAGTNAKALVWGWQHLTDTKSRRGRLGTGRLVEAVGPELAESFMTGFRQSWRLREPRLRRPGDTSFPFIDLAGLTGLSLDVEGGLDLATLTDAEVERAVRYALYELNGFPSWFERLVAIHPSQVRRVLKLVIKAEWSATVDHYGLISRAPYEPTQTAELVRELVIAELERAAPGHRRTVHHAVGALLLPTPPARDVSRLLESYVTAAAGGDVELLTEWLRGWSHFAPKRAATWLRSLASRDQPRFLLVVGSLAALLEEDFDDRGRFVASPTWTPEALEAWVQILHLAVRPENDIEHPNGKVYAIGPRDRAQQFRNRCISRLTYSPSREAYEALRRIRASKEMKPYAHSVDAAVLAQLRCAAEDLATRWSEEDILAVERGDERSPRTTAELFALVRRHLEQVAELLENHDFSYASLFAEKEKENEVQCWVASSLALMSRGLYTVEREPAVQDDKLMDISITVPGAGRVPIEIKPLYASRYPYETLEQFISDQLVGRYMRPAAVDCGIFLLVPLKPRTWRVDGRTLSFDQVRKKLERHAKRVGERAFKNVLVMTINIAASAKKRTRASSAVRSRAGKKKSRVARRKK